MAEYYSSPTPQEQQSNASSNWQEVVYFAYKGIVAIPGAIFRIVWNFFWRYLK